MANEFIARKGIVSLGNVTVSGSLTATNGFTGSFSGSTSAPGLTTQVTYNNDGVLSADSGFVYSGSNVGIGTAVPSDKLSISNGNILLDTARRLKWTDGSFIEGGGVSSIMTLRRYMGNVGIGTTPTSRLQVKGSGTTSATTAFRVENANASGSMVVLDDGNVGIGTTSPTEKLHVAGDIAITNAIGALNFIYSATPTRVARLDSDNGNLRIKADVNGTQANSFISFNIDGSEKMRITSSGNVGIGTTSPSEKLSVSGNIESLDTFILNYGNNGIKWQQLFDGANNWNLRYYNGTAWSSSAITVKTNNNVGIGTTSPSAKLQVKGTGNY
jgi:hypothetical protein